MIKNRLSSLKYKIAFVVFIMEALMLTLVLWNTLGFIETQAREDLDNRHKIAIDLVKQISSNSLFSEEYDDLQQYVEQISRDPEIVNIAVVDLSNIILSHNDFQQVGSKFEVPIPSLLRYNITKELPKLGRIKIEFSLVRITTLLENAKLMGISIAIVGMFIIAVVGLIFGSLLTRRLEHFTHVISQFEKSGDYERIDVSGNDEIATLANTFNSMSKKINQYITQIKSDKNMLEVRVSERTEELEDAKYKLIEVNKKLKHLAITDYLTQIYNRIKIDEKLESEKLRHERYGNHFSVILLDIDKFKNVNDVYGHNEGDLVLIKVAQLLINKIRNTEMTGRWGGEEFIVICPETRIDNAERVAEKLRVNISQCNFGIVGRISCSFGVVEFAKGESIRNLIRRADDALYEAKDQGRNRVIRG